jgi:hypothetical protein
LQPVVGIQDVYGNIVNAISVPVLLFITPGSGASDAVLSGNTTVNAVNGLASFDNLSINKPGAGYSLTASSGNITSAIGNDFTILPENSAAINISIVLQGSSRPAAAWNVPLTVKFFTSGNTTPVDVLKATPFSTFSVTTAKSGNTTAALVPNIISGNYDISVTSPHCLINVKRNVVIITPLTSLNMGTLLEGNANNDEKVNIQDFGLLAKTYGKQRGQEGFDENADFDRNDLINITDFGLLASNYGKHSSIEVP